MEQNRNIWEVVKNAVQYLTQKSYSSSAIRLYLWVWEKFISFTEDRGEVSYSTRLLEDFRVIFVEEYNQKGKYKFSVSIHRALRVLDDIFHNRQISEYYLLTPPHIPKSFQSVYNSYESYLVSKGQKPRTVETKLSRVLVFFRFLEERKQSIDKLEFQTIATFLDHISRLYSKTSQSNIKFTLRDFLKYAESCGFIAGEMSLMLGAIYGNKHSRLPSTYTHDEISKILLFVDRTKILGKRDYAILMLLVHLGMRSYDLSSLKLNAINYESHSLVFKQQKTGNYENLPLTETVEIALADYLKNARPASESEYLFVKCEGANKGAPISSAAIYQILNRYMLKVGTDIEGKRHGPHSIRHSLSSNLLKDGVSLSVISGILGHSSSEITTRYLWMDLEQLRKLALEVPYEI
jgi:site-specific recombinase XerD